MQGCRSSLSLLAVVGTRRFAVRECVGTDGTTGFGTCVCLIWLATRRDAPGVQREDSSLDAVQYRGVPILTPVVSRRL